ncbi:MAG: aldo/keto reductase [Phycisphaerae bacterium]
MFEPRRELGKTGFKATVLGIGDVADRSVPIEQCVATVRRAMDAGLNLIDTAPGYEDGYSEEIVGRALRESGRRDSMFVIDKIDHLDRPVADQVDGSLARLGIEAADAFVFHGPSTSKAWRMIEGGLMAQLDACRKAGKCRFVGISSHHPKVLDAAIKSGLCDIVLFPIGPWCDKRYARKILPLARSRGVGTVCFKTFGAGKLLGDTTGYGRPLEARPRGKFSSGGHEPPAPTLPHLTVSECVRYTLSVDPDVALLGMSFPNEQDAAFAAAADFKPLTPAEMAEIEARAARAIEGKGNCWWNPE